MSATAERPPSVWIVGAGAIGLYLAARLHPVAEVTLVARGERVRALRQHGVTVSGVESAHAPVHVVAMEERPRVPPDVPVLIATKAPQLLAVLEQLAPPPTAPLVLCQNGLGVAALAAGASPEAPLVRLACWFGASQRGPAEVALAGMFQLELGADGPAAIGAAGRLAQLLRDAGLPVSQAPSIAACEWRKSLWNLAVSGPCALLDAPNGAVLDRPSLRELAAALVAEAVAVASAEGVTLEPGGPGSALQTVLASTEKTRANLNAMVHDLRRGGPTEMRWLNAEVARRALAAGLAAPHNAAVARLVEAAERPQGAP